MQLDAPAEMQETPGRTEGGGPRVGRDLDVAHSHLQALLADAALLADDEDLDDRSWAELIVRMVYSTSALRHLAGHQDEDRTPPAAEAPPAPPSVAPPEPALDLAPPEPALDLPPPNPETLLATEAPPDLGAPPDHDILAIPEPSPVVDASPDFLGESAELEMPYIPESRWRLRRGRHRVERSERNYDYFQDLRRVLDELEAAEGPVTGPAVHNGKPSPAEAQAEAPTEDHGELDAAEVPAPASSSDVSKPELAEVEAPTSTNDEPSTTRDVEPSLPEIVEDHRTTGPVPFQDLSRALADLDTADPEAIEDQQPAGPIPFVALSRALAELHAAEAATMTEVDSQTLDEPVPAPPAFSEGGPAELAASVEPEVPTSETSKAGAHIEPVTRTSSTPKSAPSPRAEHMLLGALLVVAARRPIRRLLRIFGGD